MGWSLRELTRTYYTLHTHHALIQSGALCYMALCVAWRFVLHGALCYVALCVCVALFATWRFLGGAFRASLCGAFY